MEKKKMDTKIKLPLSVFERFAESGRPFAVIDSEVYTLENNRYINSEDFWEFYGKRFGLFRSESIERLADGQLTEAQEDIQSHISRIINEEFIGKIKDAESKLNKNIDYFKTLKQDSFKRFVSGVFDAYNRKKQPDMNEVNKIPEDTLPDITELEGTGALIHQVIPKPGILTCAKRCYSIKKGKRNGNGMVRFKGEDYTLEDLMGLDELVEKYDGLMKSEINNLAISHGKKYQDQIRTLNDQLSESVKQIKLTKNSLENGRMGSVGYRKLNDKDYEFYAIIEPYVFEKNGLFYTFNEADAKTSKSVKVGTTISIDKKKVSILAKPKVLNMPYFHPFVHDDGTICFNNASRWSYHDIKFSYQYDMDDPLLAKKMAILLWEAKSAITSGYVGNSIDPVYFLTRFTPVAENVRDAIAYAKKTGINEKRIFKN